MAADPSHNVHPDLLPHIHLISAYRYPLVPRFGIPEVTDWLLNAPRIARDGAPFFWTYLDAPQDGTIILTWQPLQRLGTEFATDGYVWPRGEVYYQHEIRDGLILEVFHQPVGYRPGEEYASHSRRRFRLMPPKVPNPNIPQVDPSLWLVHYGPVDEREPIPVKKIRLEPRLRTILEHRNNLQRAGQITRKEFMLSDRVNWPHIPLPRDMRGPPMYGGVPVAGHHVPQQMAYPPHVGGNLAPPPPSKRARHSAGPGPGAGAVHPGAGLVGGQPGMGPPPHMMQPMDMAIYDDDEDTSRGDMFDNITPRDVSLERYKQNHEWMEEVISSPYRIGQIGYADLGLGLKGELAPITEGIFEGQGFDAYQRVPKKPYVGRLDPGLADEFRKRVNEKIQATHAEIAEMKAHHEKLVASFREQSVIRAAEHELRTCAAVIEEGPGSLRLEERPDDNNETGSGEAGDNNPWTQAKSQEHHHTPPHKTVDGIAAHVESALSRKIVPLPAVVRVQDGGYQEPEPEPEPEPVPEPEPMLEVPPMATGPANGGAVGGINGGNIGGAGAAGSPGSQISGIMIGDGDMDMGDTAAGLLDQMESVFSPEVGVGNGPAAQPVAPAGPGVPQPGPGGPVAGGDVPMADAAPGQAPTVSAPPAGPGGVPTGDAAAPGHEDWVVVPPGGGVSPTGEAAGAAAAAPGGNVPVAGGPVATATTEATPTPMAATAGGPGAFQAPVPTTAAPAASADVPAPTAAPVPVPVSVPAPTSVGSNAPGSGVGTPGGLLEGGDNSTGNDFGELADLDTAGDALASLDDGGDLGESLDLDMDDSAFGNAFHGGD